MSDTPPTPAGAGRCEHGAIPNKCLQCAGVVTRIAGAGEPKPLVYFCDECMYASPDADDAAAHRRDTQHSLTAGRATPPDAGAGEDVIEIDEDGIVHYPASYRPAFDEVVAMLRRRAETKRADGNALAANECENCAFAVERLTSLPSPVPPQEVMLGRNPNYKPSQCESTCNGRRCIQGEAHDLFEADPIHYAEDEYDWWDHSADNPRSQEVMPSATDQSFANESSRSGLPVASGEAVPVPASPTLYPCADCGAMRTKAEGGTTFTVCDECWEKRYPKTPSPSHAELIREAREWEASRMLLELELPYANLISRLADALEKSERRAADNADMRDRAQERAGRYAVELRELEGAKRQIVALESLLHDRSEDSVIEIDEDGTVHNAPPDGWLRDPEGS